VNACHDCEPTHNRDVRERGRCWCPCHSGVPADSRLATRPDWERFGLVDATAVRATVVVDVNDADAEELAAQLRQLANRLDRTPWPPASPMVLLDPNGNRCGHLTLEQLP